MPRYTCDDGNCPVEIKAATPREAAQQYVDGGDWGEFDRTRWINVHVYDAGGDHVGQYKIQVDPPAPPCAEGHAHDWVDGLTRGNGGGVVVESQCRWCGAQKTHNTWAQDPEDGEQGFTTTEYAPASPDWEGPKPATRYWDGFRGEIEEGDVFTSEGGGEWTVHPDEDVACGWVVRKLDGEKKTLSRFLHEVDWSQTNLSSGK